MRKVVVYRRRAESEESLVLSVVRTQAGIPEITIMKHEAFEALVADIGLASVPDQFRERLSNVALVIEDDVPDATRRAIGLAPNETLLGLYQGVPLTERGSGYAFVLPDTITIYRLPTLEEATESGLSVREVVEETIWHEVAHHFGLNEFEVRHRGRKRSA
jgi:predicted Zn-dependent protease with MMP-like domain